MAKSTIEIAALGTQITVDGNTAPAVPILTTTMAALHIWVTSVSGTSPTLQLYLEGSVGKTEAVLFSEIPYSISMPTSGTSTEPTAVANGRDIAGTGGGGEIIAAGRYMALFPHLPYPYVRLAWKVGGTSPDFLLGAWLLGA